MSDPLIGTLISGRYRVESLLGRGGMGAVYLVQHTHLRRRFALKLLHAETSKTPEMVARFEIEAMAAANVDHPNVAFATDFGRTEEGSFFLVLEYLEGEALRDTLSAGPLPVRRALHITRQVAGALKRSHELGVIHRDLKPENIMRVLREGDPDFVKVLDFGLAKVATEAPIMGNDKPGQVLTQHGTIFGTPKYMAPEQCFGRAIDGRADLYALGLILFEMLTGVAAFGGKDPMAILSKQLAVPTPWIKDVAPGVSVPAALEAVVRRLTEKEREDRYADAAALLAALSEVAASEGIALPDAPGGGAGPRAAAPVEPGGEGKAAAPGEVPAGGGVAPKLEAPKLDAPKLEVPKPEAPKTDAVRAGDAAASGAATPAKAEPDALRDMRSLLQTVRSRLPGPFQQRPLLLLGALLGVLLVVLLVVVRRPAADRTGRPARPASARVASKEQIKTATGEGLPAVHALVEQYPQDPRARRALAHMYMAQEDGVQALRELGKVVALDGAGVRDGEIAQAVMLAARSADGLDAAVGLLESQLGSRGVDVLYGLAFRPAPGPIKARARQSLARPQVRASASAAAAVAIDLHAADKCEDKRGLLKRASQSGDLRALQQLKALQQTNNCGPFGVVDCWSCLRKGTELGAAIAAIEARTGAR